MQPWTASQEPAALALPAKGRLPEVFDTAVAVPATTDPRGAADACVLHDERVVPGAELRKQATGEVELQELDAIVALPGQEPEVGHAGQRHRAAAAVDRRRLEPGHDDRSGRAAGGDPKHVRVVVAGDLELAVRHQSLYVAGGVDGGGNDQQGQQ